MASQFVLFFLGCLVTAGSATVCFPSHPQSAVCNAHFVIRGRFMGFEQPAVLNDFRRPAGTASGAHGRMPFPPAQISSHGYARAQFAPRVMRIRLEKIYKGVLVVNSTTGQDILITMSSMEIPKFLNERLYIFTGFEVDGKLYTTRCSWNPLWEDVTLAQRFGLKRYYWMYCQCIIRFCPDGSCAYSNRVCNWDVPSINIGDKKTDCHSKYNVCVAKGDRCVWFGPKGKNTCQGAILP